MKGKNPTAEQKRFHDLLATHVGCQACLQDYEQPNFHVSIHHIDGRTKPKAHWMVLAVCAGHHQDGYGPVPMLAIHGAKARFEAHYGKQTELLAKAITQLVEQGHNVPEAAKEFM